MNNFNHLISRNASLLTIVGFVVGIIALASATTPRATNTVFAQDPTETPAPTSTPVPTPTRTPEPLATDTPQPTYTPAPTYTPLPTEPLQPTYTPLPTAVPQQPAQPYSGTTPFINCGPGEPCIDLHSSHTSISVDDKAQLSLSVTNALNKPNMTVRLLLEIPSGWEVDGEGFAERCSGVCNAVYDVYTAQQELIQITAYPNQTGSSRIAGRIEWRYAGEDNLYHITRDVNVRITAGANGNQQRQQAYPGIPTTALRSARRARTGSVRGPAANRATASGANPAAKYRSRCKLQPSPGVQQCRSQPAAGRRVNRAWHCRPVPLEAWARPQSR